MQVYRTGCIQGREQKAERNYLKQGAAGSFCLNFESVRKGNILAVKAANCGV